MQQITMESIVTYITECSEELLVFGAVFLVSFLLLRYRPAQNGRYNDVSLPPSLPSLPIVGSLPFLPTKMKDLAEFCISPRNKLGKIFSFCLGSK